MADDLVRDQAAAIASILPRLMRGFSVLHDDDPAMEMPVAQMRVCGILRDCSRTMSCLAKELGVSLSAMTQIADRLERAGLVERIPEVDDRRVKTLRLTPRGEDIMRARGQKRTERIAQALEHLSPESRDTVLSALMMLLDACPAATEGTDAVLQPDNPVGV